MMLVNGEYKEHIEISDRGFQYGDGLFETIAVTDGQPVFLDRHLDRLKAGCRRLYIPFPGTGLLIQEAQNFAGIQASRPQTDTHSRFWRARLSST